MSNNLPSGLSRFAIGFEPIFRDMERLINTSTYPPHNIIKISEDNVKIQIAIAGFDKSNVAVIFEEGKLIVSADKQTEETEGTFVHHGISTRAFTKEFSISDKFEIVDAVMVNGLLDINLKKKVPDHLKRKVIEISDF